jgi:hypothetical protein
MRISMHCLAVLVACTFVAPSASAQLGDALKRVRERAREVSQTVKDVDEVVDTVAGAVTTEPTAQTEPPAQPTAATAQTPPATAQDAIAQATRLAAECQQRSSTNTNFRACAALCTDVSKTIAPTTSVSDAQAVLRLCTNAYNANFAPPTPAVVAAPAAAPPAAAPTAVSPSEAKAARAPFTAAIDELVPRCQTVADALTRDRCVLFCSSYQDSLHTRPEAVTMEAAQRMVDWCRSFVDGVPPPPAATAAPTAAQVERQQKQQAQQADLKQVEAIAAAATTADYRRWHQWCEAQPPSNPYRATCIFSCQNVLSLPTPGPGGVGVTCVDIYRRAGGP